MKWLITINYSAFYARGEQVLIDTSSALARAINLASSRFSRDAAVEKKIFFQPRGGAERERESRIIGYAYFAVRASLH